MLSFHFLNVGKGDCTILEYETGGIRRFGLIDCNKTPARQSPAKEKLKQLGASKLEFVCITHPDDDHYTGILDVLCEFQVEKFFTFPITKQLSDSKARKKYLERLLQIAKGHDDQQLYQRSRELIEILVYAEKNFAKSGRWEEIAGNHSLVDVPNFLGVQLHGIAPSASVRGVFKNAIEKGDIGGSFSNNDLSIALCIEYCGKRITLGGDVLGNVWNQHHFFQSRQNISIASSLAKIPHHGSKLDCNEAFVNAVFPDSAISKDCIAIVSANGTTHPHQEAFSLLHAKGVQTLCTNLPNFYIKHAQKLITDKNLSAPFLGILNTHAETTSRISQPCQGDITVSVSSAGALYATSQFRPFCPCSKRLDAFVA